MQAFYIPSGSMEHTLLIKDRVLVNKVVYRFRDIHRGEIVVFNGLDSFDQEIAVTPAKGFGKIQRKIASVIGLGAPGREGLHQARHRRTRRRGRLLHQRPRDGQRPGARRAVLSPTTTTR